MKRRVLKSNLMNQHQPKRLSDRRSTASRNTIAFIFIAVFLDFLGTGLLIPVIPFLVAQFDGNALTVGLVALSFFAAQFIATPAWGKLSDRYGRKPILIISSLGTGLSFLIFGFANALWLLFVARLVDGLTGVNVSIAQAYIADVSSNKNRAQNFALIGAAFGLGFTVGPALGGLLSQISLQTPAFVAATLSLLTAAFAFFIIPESLKPDRRKRAIALKELNPFGQVNNALRRPRLRRFLLANFAIDLAFSGLQTNFALYTFVRFDLGTNQNGILFAYVGIVSALMEGLIIRYLVKRFSERRLTIVGLGLMSLGYIWVALASVAWMLYPCLALIAVGSGMAVPTLTSTISKKVSQRQQGTILGAAQAISSLALIVGPVWAGFTFDYFGTSIPYWTGAFWLVVALVLVVDRPISIKRLPKLNKAR